MKEEAVNWSGSVFLAILVIAKSVTTMRVGRFLIQVPGSANAPPSDSAGTAPAVRARRIRFRGDFNFMLQLEPRCWSREQPRGSLFQCFEFQKRKADA